MLRDEICSIVKQYLSVAFLSENQIKWMDLENLDGEYVPVHYGFYNVIYQKKYFEAVYDEYTDISVIIFGGGNFSLHMAVSLLEKRYELCYRQQWLRVTTSLVT